MLVELYQDHGAYEATIVVAAAAAGLLLVCELLTFFVVVKANVTVKLLQ
jgi:hypothetical protein